MSVDPVGNIQASAAGAPYAQSASVNTNETLHAAKTGRKIAAGQPANHAMGVSAADRSGLETADRDGDGRPPWILPAREDQTAAGYDDVPDTGIQHRDSEGQRGNRVDLVG